MLVSKKFYLDRNAQHAYLTAQYVDTWFDDLDQIDPQCGEIVAVERELLIQNTKRVVELIERGCHVILWYGTEASKTLWDSLCGIELGIHALSGNFLLIAGGEADPALSYMPYESLMLKVADFPGNLEASCSITEIFNKTDKPYKFLFLNGRTRRHRKYLLERFQQSGLLGQALWTCLEGLGYANDPVLRLHDGTTDLMLRPRPIQYLPTEYELPQIQYRLGIPWPPDTPPLVKYHLFDGVWLDAAIYNKPYVDTYFSLVTETIFESPYKFLTEKIWKPILIGHPWVCAANAGFYRHMHNMGFRTFGSLIDESFDDIDNHQDRIERFSKVIEDLCRQDLSAWLRASESICQYNRLHYLELVDQERATFARRFVDSARIYIGRPRVS